MTKRIVPVIPSPTPVRVAAPKGDPAKYLSDTGAPWKKLGNEKPKGETINYDKLLQAWKDGKVR